MRKARALLAVAVWVLGTSTGRAGEAALPAAGVVPFETKSCSCWASCKASCHRFCDWFTYQPLKHSCACSCCLQAPFCCRPPLYAFFLGNCGLPPVAHGTGVVVWEEPSKGPGPDLHKAPPPPFPLNHSTTNGPNGADPMPEAKNQR